MKKSTAKTKRKQQGKQSINPIQLCVKSLSSYLDSYLTALDTATATATARR